MEVDIDTEVVNEDQSIKQDLVVQGNDIKNDTKVDLNNLQGTVLKEEDMNFEIDYEESESEEENQSSGSDYEDELKPQNLKCNHCDKEFSSEISLKTHRNREHPGKKRGPKKYHRIKERVEGDNANPWNVADLDEFLFYWCPECDSKHLDKTQLINHATLEHPQSHPYLPTFKLKEEQEYNTFEVGDWTDDIVDDNIDNDEFRDQVDEPFNTDTTNVKVEMQEVENGSDYEEELNNAFKYSCNKCDKEFTTEGRLKIHRESVHPGKKRGAKPGTVYKSKVQKLEIDEPIVTHQCTICEREFRSKAKLIQHTNRKNPCQRPTKQEENSEVKVEGIKEEPFDVDNDNEEPKPDVEKYVCIFCPKEFEYRISWHKHIHSVHKQRGRPKKYHAETDPKTGKKAYKCDECGMFMPNVSALSNHKRKHDEAKEQVSENGTEAKVHAKKHVCMLCNKVFDWKNLLDVHMRECHTVEGKYQCQYCLRDFNQNCLKYLFHLTKEHDIGEYQNICDICGKGFVTKKNLQTHIEAVHEKINLNLICEICGISNRTERARAGHMRRYHTEVIITKNDVTKACPKCKEEYDSPIDFESHLKMCLDELKDYKCNLCDLRWASHLSVEMHLAVDHKKLHGACDICGGIYTSKKAVAQHKKLVHDRIYDFCCHICAKPLETKHELKSHLARIHNIGEKKHKCKYCDERFFAPYGLKQHIAKKHERRLEHQCHLCSKTFWMKDYLRDHIKFIHEKYRPNKCDLCTEAYLYKRDLIRHKANVHHIHV